MMTRTQFDALVSAVLSRRPVLQNVLETFGGLSIMEYARRNLVQNPEWIFPARKEEFLKVFRAEVGRLFTSEQTNQVAAELGEFPVVSTADHHGPLTSPFFTNPNLLSAYVAQKAETVRRWVTVFPGANVSLNNSSFPRGLLFTASRGGQGERDGGAKTHRLSFLPSNSHAASLYGFRPYEKREVQKNYEALREKVRAGEISQKLADQLQILLQEVYDRDELYACADFSDQMVKSNFALWRKFFPAGSNAPDLLFLPQENMAVALFLAYHLEAPTILHRVFFNFAWSKLIMERFNGVQGAFDVTKNEGTYFFWGMAEKKHMAVPLRLEGGFLINADADLKIPYTPASVGEALRKKQLVPSLLFNFVVLSFYYGVRCFGGFNQINYLTSMKERFMSCLRDMGESKEAAALEKLHTKGLIGDLTLAYVKSRSGKFYPATGVDLILYHNPNTWKIMTKMAERLSLADAIYPLVAEFYPIVYEKDERKAELSAITPDDLTEYLGISQKIAACVEL